MIDTEEISLNMIIRFAPQPPFLNAPKGLYSGGFT